MEYKWEDGFTLSVRITDDAALISGNVAGLLSLARHLTALAQESPGSHIHLDAYNALEDGSDALIVEKTP